MGRDRAREGGTKSGGEDGNTYFTIHAPYERKDIMAEPRCGS